MSLDSKSIAKSSMIITIVLVVSKIIGFVRELLIATQFGANIESDIFKTATKMPQLFLSCVAAALVTTFIPVFSNVKNDKEKANEFFNNILNIVFILCAILSIIGIIFSKQLAVLFAVGFSEADIVRTSQMTKIVMPAIIFLALSGLYTGYLQSYGKFVQPAMTGIAANVLIIFGIVVFSKYGIIAAIIAFLVSSIAQIWVQRPFMGDYKYKFYIDIHDKNVRKMLMIAIPILISTAVGQINVIVDSRFASTLAPGSISIVDYASKLSTLINQVFIVSLTTIFYPMLTERWANEDKKGFYDLITKSVNIVVIVAVPLIFGMMALSLPLVKLLLQHGKFNSNDSVITSICLRYLAFSALGYSLIDILGKIFFSVKDTVTPMINGFIMVGLNILLIVVLVPKFGVQGLAMATTSSAVLISLIMIIELKFKLKQIRYKNINVVLFKALAAGIAMALLVSLSYKGLDIVLSSNKLTSLSIKILISTLVGVGSYTALLYILRVDELKTIINMKLRKNN